MKAIKQIKTTTKTRNQVKNKSHIILIFLSLILCLSCSQRPKGVMSKGKMANVLYDYHLVQSMIEAMPFDKRDVAQDYLDAVYDKYDITEAEFDSSMAYYNRHTDDLKDIYERLQTKFEQADQTARLQTGSGEMRANYSENGDTTDIWSGRQLFVLHPDGWENREVFSIKADSTFHLADQFTLTASIDFVPTSNDDPSRGVVMSISVRFLDGKNISQTRFCSMTNRESVTVGCVENRPISHIFGSFYFKGDDHARGIAIVKDISLIRIHRDDMFEEVDTIFTDSATTDTVILPSTPSRPRRILTPEQLRERTTGKENAEIRTAPAVRTPNSIGPRRRIRRQ